MYSSMIVPLNCAQEMIPDVQEWEVTNGNTNCKEHGHRLWPRTVPEQKSGKNYPEEAAEHISPDPEQSTSICQHSILTATFWDGSMHFHHIVTKITAIKTTQWMLELALHEDGHTPPHCCYAPGAGCCCSHGSPPSVICQCRHGIGNLISRNPANQGQNSSISTFSWPFVWYGYCVYEQKVSLCHALTTNMRSWEEWRELAFLNQSSYNFGKNKIRKLLPCVPQIQRSQAIANSSRSQCGCHRRGAGSLVMDMRH